MTADQSFTSDVVQPDQINREWLLELFKAAYLPVERDGEGDICIREGFHTWVFLTRDGRQIRFLAQFRANPDHPMESRLRFVNQVNDELNLIRAYVDRDGDIAFDAYLIIAGGVTRQNIVYATRMFIEHVRAAALRDEKRIMG